MATPKKKRSRKAPTEPTVPADAVVWTPWEPGTPPPWLDGVLADPLPFGAGGGKGRPKGCQTVRDAIVGHIAGCGSWVHACKLAGVVPRSAEKWLAQGRREQEEWEARLAAGEDPGKPTELHLWARSITLAGGWWSGHKLAALQRLGEDPETPVQYRMAILQWLLSRIGDKLSERVEVEHSGEVTTTVAEVADDMRARLAEMKARREALARGESE